MNTTRALLLASANLSFLSAGLAMAQALDGSDGVDLGGVGSVSNAPHINLPSQSGGQSMWDSTPALQGYMVPAAQLTGLSVNNTAVDPRDLLPVQLQSASIIDSSGTAVLALTAGSTPGAPGSIRFRNPATGTLGASLSTDASGNFTLAGSPLLTAGTLASSISALPNLEISGGIKAGLNNWTSGYAFGPATKADKWSSTAFGYNTVAGAEGAFAAGWHCKAMGWISVAFGHGSETYGAESISMGRGNRAYGNDNLVGGWGSKTHNFNSFAYGHSCEANSQNGPTGYETDSFAIAMGSYASATSDHTIALGYGATATATLANAIGRSLQANTMYEHNIGVCAKISAHNDSWAESDAIYRLGNSPDWNDRSDAITVLKNGQTTLTNKAWSRRDPATVPATSDPSAAPDDAQGNALVVDGHTVLNGKVIISQPQGDISMGAYQ